MTAPIARDPASRDRLLHQWHGVFSLKGEIECGQSEIALLVAAGEDTLLGVFEQGRHRLAELRTETALTDRTRVFFLSTAVHELAVRFPQPFTDPGSEVTVRITFSAVLQIKLDSPRAFFDKLMVGQRQDAIDAMEGYLSYQAQRVISSALQLRVMGELEAGGTLLGCIDTTSPEQLISRGVDKLRGQLQESGLILLGLASAFIGIDEAERAKLSASRQTRSSLAPGGRVMVQWADGNYYPASIRQVSRGHCEVLLDLGGEPVWVQPQYLRPI